MVHNTALLVVESKRSASSEVHAQVIAEATCLAASNSRLGYSIPIHVVVTNQEETTFYTYDPSAKKFYEREHFTMEDLQSESDLGEDPDDVRELQLQRMTVVLARDLFSLIVEVYYDFIQATIHRCRLPLAFTLWRQNDSMSAMNTVSCGVFAQPCNQLELLLSVSFT
ncbi:hypothetical protein EV421DRAFT_872897 [Armillaria borealis]|uniref:Uncharacterized protein n=1 Tax=Armillaria borealis TaxID=47425 RepID=A0AA39JAF5_9AGAR|nr:hypothetical protein EV421DRAFT_872897 [Armillaria borealis]